ncbi:MAG: hypothetical protein ACON5B_14880 [Myxococcota bacterium]
MPATALPFRLAALSLMFGLSACLQEVNIGEIDRFEAPEPDNTPADWGSWMSMDVTPDGQRLALAYYMRDEGALGFATGTPAEDGSVSWFHERVDGFVDEFGRPVGDRGKYASMKVAPDGTVWIAYHQSDKSGLFVAHRKGGVRSWEVYTVIDKTGSEGGPGQWASLDLDANGQPVVASYNGTDGTLQLSRPTALEQVDYTQWTTTTIAEGQPFTGVDAKGEAIERPADVGQYAKLLIQGTTEYIAYYDAAQQRLGLLEGSAGAYNQTWVSPEGTNMGTWPSLLLDGGTVIIGFQDVSNQDLVIASRGTGGFTLEIADAGAYRGADVALAPRNGTIGALYFDGQNNDLRYAEKSGTVWVTSLVHGDGAAAGFHNEVVRVGEIWWAGTYDYATRQPFFTTF